MDDFQALKKKVGALESEYKEYSESIPVLKLEKKELDKIILETNEKLFEAQQELEKTRTEISKLKEDHQAWVTETTQNLSKRESDHDTKVIDVTRELKERETKLHNDNQELLKSKRDVLEQISNAKMREEELEKRSNELSKAELECITKLAELTDREELIKQTEADTETKAKNTEQYLERAKTVFDDATAKSLEIANEAQIIRKQAAEKLAKAENGLNLVDIRTQELNQREAFLNAREQQQNARDKQLNDRAAIVRRQTGV